MRQNHQRGFSLVETMVAVTLSMLTILVVTQVLTTYEASKRTTTGANDAEISAAVGLFMLEREVRMAGAGLTMPAGMACNVGFNVYFDGDTAADGASLAPLEITDGGAGTDQITVIRSDAPSGFAPTHIVKAMPTPSSILTVDWNAGLADRDLFLVGSHDGSKICTLMQMTQAPQATGNGWNLNHNSGLSDYNPPQPSNAFTTAMQYEVGDIVSNMGQFGLRRFGVICSDGEVPGVTNSCNLVSYDLLAAPATPTLADVDSLTAQVVDLQAQYGITDANSQTVTDWVDATGATWGAPTIADLNRIKAVRIAIVTRGNLEREIVSPAELVLWDAGLPGERTLALDDDQRHYRYRVLSVVVPLINVIWAGI